MLHHALQASMSNYSVWFLLQNNGLRVNCLVFLLTLGLISYSDLYLGHASGNISSFLPAYYVTNCLISLLRNEIVRLSLHANLGQWIAEYKKNPYNVSDNGELFVALLFIVSASCVLCWMLILLFVFSPRKPFLTICSTLFYSICLTVLLAHITDGARTEYYADALDLIAIMNIVNRHKRYPIAFILSQLLTHCAFLQLALKMLRHRRAVLLGGLTLIIAIAAVLAVDVATTNDYTVYLFSDLSRAVSATKVALIVVYFLAFAAILARHTFERSLRRLAYLNRLLPLSAVTWFVVGAHIVCVVLTISLWRTRWLVLLWFTFLPLLLEMYLLTLVWEWLSLIKKTEKQMETVGMLGRRISATDALSFSNPAPKTAVLRGKFASAWALFWPVATASLQQELNEWLEKDLELDRKLEDPELERECVESIESADVSVEWEVEQEELHVGPTEGPSRAHELPAFEPHPGYSRDDYWDDK